MTPAPTPAAPTTAPTPSLAMARPVEPALTEFFTTHGLDRGGYSADKLVVRLGPLRFPFPNPGFLPFHDLHHLALNAPPRFWGEVEVSALELRSGCPTALIWLLCMAAMVLGALVAPRRVWRTWRRYAGCKNLYRGHRYEDLLALDLHELRRKMGVSSAPHPVAGR